MSIVDDRQEAIKRHKTRRGCEICGRRDDPGMLVLVPRNGVGLTISRLLTRASLSDEKFWGEVRRRAVLCRSCSRRGR